MSAIEVQSRGTESEQAFGAIIHRGWQARSDGASIPVSELEATELIDAGAYLNDEPTIDVVNYWPPKT